MAKTVAYKPHELDVLDSSDDNAAYHDENQMDACEDNDDNGLAGFEVDEDEDEDQEDASDNSADDDDDDYAEDEGDAKRGNDDDDDDEDGKDQRGATVELTKEVVDELKVDIMKKVDSSSIRPLAVALRSVTADDKNNTRRIVTDAGLARKVVLLAFTHIPEFIAECVGEKAQANPTSSPKWKKISGLCKFFLSDALRQLGDCTDESTLVFGLQAIQKISPCILAFHKIANVYFKLLLRLWSTVDSMEARVVAFASIRHLAATYPKRYLVPSLKGTYLAFSKVSRHTNARTYSMLTFMTRCAVEVYGLRPERSYAVAFTYLRQLAVHLRNAVTLKGKDTVRIVHGWQYMQALRFWTNVLATHAATSRNRKPTTTDGASSAAPSSSSGAGGLTPLVYPLVQILLGTLRLRPTPGYNPLHLQILSQLGDLVTQCGVYVPLLPLYGALLASAVARPARPSTLKPLHMPVFLRCPPAYAGTTVYAAQITQEAQHGVLKYAAALSCSVAFPEIAAGVCASLRRTAKTAAAGARTARPLQALALKIEETAAFVAARRTAADLAPADAGEIATFERSLETLVTPLQKYWDSVRRVEQLRAAEIADSFTGDAGPEIPAPEKLASGKNGNSNGKRRKSGNGSGS